MTQSTESRTVRPDARAPFGVGLLKGLAVTVKHLKGRPSTQMYPKQRPELAPRTRGVIALMDENCTVCMLCARECPDWCIYIDSHKETVPPAKEGGRARTRNVLDRFAIDFALCMYCGICVEVCPFDALFWSPEFEYAEYAIDGLLHEMDRLREWADTVPPPPPLDEGAETPPEVADAIAKKESELEAAQAAAEQKQVEQEQAKAAPADAGGAAAAAAGGGRPKPQLADMEIEGETQIDQEVFDQLIAEGKSERMARSKAKSAWVKAQKQKLLDQAIAEWEAEQAAAGGGDAGVPADGGGQAAPADAEAAAAPAEPKLADVHVEGAGEIDQEVYDQLIAEGKSERIARAKAKAAWVRKKKAEAMAEQAGDQPDDQQDGDAGGDA
jgi:NADH-quinone oxidoreductase subunit I